MGFTTLSLKDAMVNYVDDVVSIIQVPIAVLIIIALFFIAYFVIRLILASAISVSCGCWGWHGRISEGYWTWKCLR